jgi:hypothetical protein
MSKILSWLTKVLAVMAVVFSVRLLVGDTKVGIPIGLPPGVISAAPLFLIGVTFLVAQIFMRPRWTELLKNVLLAAAFILWSVVQLMEQNALSKKLGDVVIALYVLDLAWVILASGAPAGTVRSSPTRSASPDK